MKSDLLNNYDKIYIVGDFNYPSIRWDAEWSNNKDNEFVEYVRSVFLTQMVKKRKKERKKKKKKKNRKREGHASNLFGLVRVNEESMVSGTEHISPGKRDNETLVFLCVKKSKRNKNKNLSMI